MLVSWVADRADSWLPGLCTGAVRPFGAGTLCFLPDQREDPDPPRLPDPRRAALMGLIVTLLLVVVGVFLVRVLGRTSRLQDCVMSGRTDCAPIDSPMASSR